MLPESRGRYENNNNNADIIPLGLLVIVLIFPVVRALHYNYNTLLAGKLAGLLEYTNRSWKLVIFFRYLDRFLFAVERRCFLSSVKLRLLR